MTIARQWFTIHWPREFSIDEAQQLLFGLHGAANGVVVELVATADRVEHRFGVANVSATALEERLRHALPSLILKPTKREVTAASHVWRIVRRDVFPFSVDRAETVSRAVLAATAAVRGDEVIVLQWVLGRSLAPALVPERAIIGPADTWTKAFLLSPFKGSQQMPSADRRRLQSKWSLPGWRVSGRIGVSTKTPVRSRQFAYALLAALRLAEGPGAHLHLRRTTKRSLIAARMSPLATGSVNAAELMLLVGVPLGEFAVPRLVRQRHRVLLPQGATSSKGVVLARSHRGERLRLSTERALEHLAVVSPTGGGKSTLCLSMIEQYLCASHGLVLVDPKGDLASAVLERVPIRRRDDVVVLDPLDSEAVVGLNPLAGGSAPDHLAGDLLSVLKGLYGDGLGYRSEDIIHAGLLTLAYAGDQTLVALPLLLTDSNFRRRLLPKIADEPILMQFWAWFDASSEPERTAMLAAPLNKLRPFLYSKHLRRVLGQPKPRFSLQQIFSERKILIVSLARGRLGSESSLLGALLINQLWRTIERRVSIPVEKRHMVPIILDEAADYLRLPLDLGEALAKARGYGASFTLVAQSLQLLPTGLRSSILANARNKVLFTLAPDDARIMAGATLGQLDATDFMRLPRYEVYVELTRVGWFSGRTEPPSRPTSNADEIRALSRERFGIPVAEIDTALGQQLGMSRGDSNPPLLGRRARP